MLMFICMYVYVCISLSNKIMIFHANVYIYVYIYVFMSLSHRVIRDYSSGGMIAYAGEWHEEVLGLTRNPLGRVALTNI